MTEINYVILRKDGTRVSVKGHFLKYDGGNVMVVRVSGDKNTVAAVINMEAVVAVVDATGMPKEPK
jgi:hypothetical protein